MLCPLSGLAKYMILLLAVKPFELEITVLGNCLETNALAAGIKITEFISASNQHGCQHA